MRFRNLIFINKKSKVIVLKRYLMKKNRMSKFKKIMKLKEIKLMIPTKKLKLIWMEWTKLMKKTWKEKKERNKSKLTQIIQIEPPKCRVCDQNLSNLVHNQIMDMKCRMIIMSILAECQPMIIPHLIKEGQLLNKHTI